MLRFLIIDFIVIDWSWWIGLLLFLEPAEAKEEYVGSYSIIHTNNITLPKDSQMLQIRYEHRKPTYVASPRGTSTTCGALVFDRRSFFFPLLSDDGRTPLKKVLKSSKREDEGLAA
jgi:hypothetical protein